MFKLLPYQERLAESKRKKVLCNWSRGAGFNFTIAYMILTKRPKRVLFVDDYGSSSTTSYLSHKINETIEFLHIEDKINKNSTNKDKIFIEFDNGQKVEIIVYANRNKDLYRDMRNEFDYLIFQNIWSHKNYDDIYQGKQEIIIISENNYDQHLQNSYPEHEFIEVDIHDVVSANLFSRSRLESIINDEYYYKQYAILENPNSRKFEYEDFKNKTLVQLEKEYSDTSKNKDTILTRKNIIEMIMTLNKN